jgi:hypothetical protein
MDKVLFGDQQRNSGAGRTGRGFQTGNERDGKREKSQAEGTIDGG